MSRRKRKPEESSGGDDWLATYADLVTLLLCFFVLLFAFSEVDAKKFEMFIGSFPGSTGVLDSGKGIDPDASLDEFVSDETSIELQEIAKELEEYLDDKGYSEMVSIEENDKYVRMSFSSGVLFEPGETELKGKSIDVLDAVGVKLLEYKENRMKIEGHTDNVPTSGSNYKNNWYLSAARAITVAEYYINQKEFKPEMLSAEGFGEYVPVATNDTPDGRRKNRRIEIKILSSEGSEDYFDDEE